MEMEMEPLNEDRFASAISTGPIIFPKVSPHMSLDVLKHVPTWPLKAAGLLLVCSMFGHVRVMTDQFS